MFSQRSRTDASPRRHSESTFAHLDRRAGDEFDRIRELIQAWLQRVPTESRHDCQRRMRSGKDDAFDAAFVELYTHEILHRTGYEVELHPRLSSSTHRPDFIAAVPDRKASSSNACWYRSCQTSRGVPMRG